MTIAHLSLIILSLFMLHEFDEIILVRPWIQKQQHDPRYRKEFFIAGKAHYPSTEAIAVMIAEEYLLASIGLLIAITWHIPELALAFGICHTLHLLVHIAEVAIKARQATLHKGRAQLMQVRTIVRRANTNHFALSVESHKRVEVAILTISATHQIGHQLMKTQQSMLFACKIQATFVVHRLHDKAGDVRGLTYLRLFYCYHLQEKLLCFKEKSD